MVCMSIIHHVDALISLSFFLAKEIFTKAKIKAFLT